MNDALVPEIPGLAELRTLARGGYATVYRAVQRSVDREVAVKVENRALSTEADRGRFLREARAAGRMSGHPNVVDLFDAGITDGGHPYLIMELCAGSYADRIRESPLRAAEARDVGVKIADALADAHDLGVLHRDVKPANILLSRFGEPTLADFGLAVLAEVRDTPILTEILTPAYAPPEMFGPCESTSAVDVYSLSATLYTLLRGRPPRWCDDTVPSMTALIALFERPIPAVPGVPDALVEVLRSGMVNEPADRPTATALRDALAALPLGPPVPLPHVTAPRGPVEIAARPAGRQPGVPRPRKPGSAEPGSAEPGSAEPASRRQAGDTVDLRATADPGAVGSGRPGSRADMDMDTIAMDPDLSVTRTDQPRGGR